MIVVDTSALMAIMLDEADAEACIDVLEAATTVAISAGTLAEALIVADRRGVKTEMRRLVDGLAFEVAPVTSAVAARVAAVHARWGKGQHSAALNFGDCFAYELAEFRQWPLLFVGEDFTRTDIRSARSARGAGMAETTGDLFGRDEQEKTIERLFFGLMLPADAAASATRVLEAARREEGLKGSAIREDRMHVTLIHVGDYLGAVPDSVIADARRAVDGVSAKSFDIGFDHAASFSGRPGRQPFVLLSDQADALRAFRAELRAALVRGGVRSLSKEAFTPHVTLTYGDVQLPRREIATIRWRPTDLVLIHSEVGRSTYHVLGRWPLEG